MSENNKPSERNWTEETLFFLLKCAAGFVFLVLVVLIIHTFHIWWTARVTEELPSGQNRSHQGRVALDLVLQQPDGQIRSEILLNRPYHVQDGLSENAHHGQDVAPTQVPVVLPDVIQASPVLSA